MKEQDRKKIQVLLRLINDYTNKIIDPDDVPELIVRDILMGHIRDLYEEIYQLKLDAVTSQNVDEVVVEKPKKKEKEEKKAKETSIEEIQEEESIEELKRSIAKLRKQFGDMDSPTEKKEAPVAEAPVELPEEPVNIPESEPAPTQMEEPGSTAIGEKFQDDRSSLNDLLSLKNGEDSIGEKMKFNQVSNLKSAIDLNNKFLFIRELFEGNSDEYNQTIEELNSVDTLDEAAKILDKFRYKYKWTEKEDTLCIFNEIIHRKF